MRKKSKFVFKIVIFIIWMVLTIYFDTLHFRKESFFSSMILLIGLIVIIVYDRFHIWWIKLFHISRRAYHERGNFTINDTEPLTLIPEQKDPKKSMVIHKQYSVYPIDGMNIPSQWISKPGGGEDGYFIGPTEYITKNGAELDLGVSDVDVYITAKDKQKLPDDMIPILKQACENKGYMFNDEVPLYVGEVPSIRTSTDYLRNILTSKEILSLNEETRENLNEVAKLVDGLGVLKNRMEWAISDNADAWEQANKWKQEARSSSTGTIGSNGNTIDKSGTDGPEGPG